MPLQLWVQAARLGLRIKEVGVPRLYLDPNRAFGGVLNDAAAAAGLLPPRASPPPWPRSHSLRHGPARESAGPWRAVPCRPGRRAGERDRCACEPREDDGSDAGRAVLWRSCRFAPDRQPGTSRTSQRPTTARPAPRRSCVPKPPGWPWSLRAEATSPGPVNRSATIGPRRGPPGAGISRSCSIPASGSRTSPSPGLAKPVHGTALNLIVDNDIAKSRPCDCRPAPIARRHGSP